MLTVVYSLLLNFRWIKGTGVDYFKFNGNIYSNKT